MRKSTKHGGPYIFDASFSGAQQQRYRKKVGVIGKIPSIYSIAVRL